MLCYRESKTKKKETHYEHDPEQLEEPVECDTCGQRQLATQTWQVDASAGTWLWVVVKLFDKEGKKLPSEVEISAVITKDENTFKLLAVISHTGATLARGHYVAYRSTPSGGFIRRASPATEEHS